MRDGYGRPDSGGVGLNVLIRKNYCSYYETQIRWVFVLCPSRLRNSMISIGYLIGTIIAGILVLASIVAILIGRSFVRQGKEIKAQENSRSYDYDDKLFLGRILFWCGCVVLPATIGLWIGATFPSFDMQYHKYKPVSGNVEVVQTRLLAQDHGTTQYYVVKLSGDSTAYRCDDSRCSLLKPGSFVHLRCIREWQYASTPGWTCNYDQKD